MSDQESDVVGQAREALAALFSSDDPAAKFIQLSQLLKQWPDLHREVRKIRQETADGLHDSGMPYAEIGGLIGVTESRARHIAKGIVHPAREKAKATRKAEEGEVK